MTIPALPIPAGTELSAVPVGLRDDGKPWQLGLLGTHIFLAGVTGSGKGSILWSLLRGLAPAIKAGTVRVWALDPKGVPRGSQRAPDPGIGAHRLPTLEPEHLERLYARMQLNGSKPATAHQAHRTIRVALNEAVRRKHLTQNPALLAKPPSLDDEEVEPFSLEEIRLILEAAGQRRNRARWAIALALGLRQGEALGIKWSDVELDAGTITVRRNRLRPKWQHGCGNKCGHTHGGYCPDRRPTRPATGKTKSKAGRRTIGLPVELVELLRQHAVEQQQERWKAGQLWHDEGWLFVTPTGGPINPRTDYDEWKKLLTLAKVRDGRLHDARHTAATVLLLLGVSERAVMGLMGWSHSAMTGRYQHITAAVRHDIAAQVGGLIWQVPSERGDMNEAGR